MKYQKIFLSAIIAILLVISGCREVTVTTIVHPNGTFTRIITVTGDSTDVFKRDLPFPVDDTWTMESAKDTADSTKYVVTYTKLFRNSKQLNREIAADTGINSTLTRNIDIRKRFGFFYSYLSFRETFKSMNQFTYLNYKDYLTDEDIQWFTSMRIPVTGPDSTKKDEAEEKVESFLIKSATAEIEAILKNGIEQLHDPQLDPNQVDDYQDSIYAFIQSWSFDSTSDILSEYQRWTGNEAVSKLRSLTPPLFEEFYKKASQVDAILELEPYTEVVELPGLITATNSSMLNGNEVRWDFTGNSVMLTDYKIFVESRVVNYWAFVVSGVVLLLLVILLIIKAFR